MRAMSCFLLVLATATCAQATERVFVTTSSDGYGLENPANHMVPTISTVNADGNSVNGYDYQDYYGNPGPIRPGLFPPVDAPSGDIANPVQILAGDWAYLWLQFQNESKAAEISGLQITITGGPVSTTYYLCNNLQSSVPGSRWDGTATPPDYPEWHNNNPQTMIAITAHGLTNSVVSSPWNLWDATKHIYLLGAVEAPPDGTVYAISGVPIMYTNLLYSTIYGGVFQFVGPPACTGDLNCDGAIDFADVNPFVLLLSDQAVWQATFPGCPLLNADINADGTYGQWSFGDINPFVVLMTNGQGPCP